MATWPITIDDDNSGYTGTIVNDALFDQVKAYIDGDPWTDVPFSAANYTASSGAWTVTAPNQVVLAYRVTPSTVMIQWSIEGVQTLTAATTYLYVRFPGIPSPVKLVSTAFSYFHNGAVGAGNAKMTGDKLALIRDIGGTQWPAGPSISIYLMGELFYAW